MLISFPRFFLLFLLVLWLSTLAFARFPAAAKTSDPSIRSLDETLLANKENLKNGEPAIEEGQNATLRFLPRSTQSNSTTLPNLIWDVLNDTPISSTSIIYITIIIFMLMGSIFLWDLFFESMEQILRQKNRHILAMIRKLLMELAFLGVWSAIIYFIEIVVTLDQNFRNFFDLTHISMFLLVIFFIALVFFMIILSFLTFHIWYFFERRDRAVVLKDYEEMDHSLKRSFFFIRWFYYLTIRYNVMKHLTAYIEIRQVFIDGFQLSSKFHFNRYLKRTTKDLYTEWSQAHWSIVFFCLISQFFIWVAVTYTIKGRLGKGIAYLILVGVELLWFSLLYFKISESFNIVIKKPEIARPTAVVLNEWLTISGKRGPAVKGDQKEEEQEEEEEEEEEEEDEDELASNSSATTGESFSDDEDARSPSRSKKRGRPRGIRLQELSAALKNTGGSGKSESDGFIVPSTFESPNASIEESGEAISVESRRAQLKSSSGSVLLSHFIPIPRALSKSEFYDVADSSEEDDISIPEDESWVETWTSSSSWYSSEQESPVSPSKAGIPINNPQNNNCGDDTKTGGCTDCQSLPASHPAHHHHHHHHHHHIRYRKAKNHLTSDLQILTSCLIPLFLCRLSFRKIFLDFKNSSPVHKLFWFNSTGLYSYLCQLFIMWHSCVCAIALGCLIEVIDVPWMFDAALIPVLVFISFFHLPAIVYKFSILANIGDLSNLDFIYEVQAQKTVFHKRKLIDKIRKSLQLRRSRDKIWMEKDGEQANQAQVTLPPHPRKKQSESETEESDYQINYQIRNSDLLNNDILFNFQA